MVSANREILSRHRVWKTMIDSSVRRRTATIYMRERFPPNETFHVRSVVRSGNRMIPATMEIAKDANGANNSVSDVEMELVKGGDDLVGSCLDLLSRLAFTSAPIAPAPTAAAPVTAAGTGTDLLTRYNGKYGFNRVNLEAHKDCSLQALCTVLWYMYTGGIHRRVDPADFIITTFDLRTSPVLPQTQRPQGQTSQWYDIRRWDSRTRYRFECPEVLWPDLLIAASWFGLEDLKAYCEKKVLMTRVYGVGL
ncbi:hypothetical protein BC939DRAFT_442337 [Gamsiella multidivaricata]|uniref:uncharacterized protein n=1 Tax=Gamsiella multidivaricata TaxID=101098 RepID=UPI00221F1B17|nr:uncharacterized protein BC939DRAFT_442337 [Gamsiella multidivaricata]KAI7828941.1 hypothetical protein BC939DRAFT_442337 [Gamsiella multidivaricata]